MDTERVALEVAKGLAAVTLDTERAILEVEALAVVTVNMEWVALEAIQYQTSTEWEALVMMEVLMVTVVLEMAKDMALEEGTKVAEMALQAITKVEALAGQAAALKAVPPEVAMAATLLEKAFHRITQVAQALAVGWLKVAFQVAIKVPVIITKEVVKEWLVHMEAVQVEAVVAVTQEKVMRVAPRAVALTLVGLLVLGMKVVVFLAVTAVPQKVVTQFLKAHPVLVAVMVAVEQKALELVNLAVTLFLRKAPVVGMMVARLPLVGMVAVQKVVIIKVVQVATKRKALELT